MTETTNETTTLGPKVKTEIEAAEKAVLDIVDLAALMNSIADGMKSDVAQITGPQLALLAGLLNDRAEAAYDVISTVANWAPEAQAALYAVHGVKGAAA